MVALVLVQCHYVGVSHVLGNVALLPAKTEEIMERAGQRLSRVSELQAGCRQSMVLLSSSRVGFSSSSSMTGRSGKAPRAASVTMFWVEYNSR